MTRCPYRRSVAPSSRLTARQLRYAAFVGVLVGTLTACSTAQLDKFSAGAARVEPALQAACDTALRLANIAGLIPGVGAIVPYISVGCGTATGLARLAADASSTEWVGTLIGKIEVLAHARGVKL